MSSQAVELTKALVKIESTDPGRYEGALAAYVQDWLAALPSVTVRRSEVLPGRANLMAELPGTDASLPALVFICHMDTVVVGEGWTLPPFAAVEREGRIYGRGACDMKSGLACCLSAFGQAARRRAQRPEPRTLKFIGTVDEEDFMRGAEAVIRDGWVTAQDWVLDAEPTNGQIQVAHKGRTWFEVTMEGVTAHASTPWKGADAVAAMAETVCGLRRAIQNAPAHEELGRSTVTFGQIEGGYRPYVVADRCKLWVDLRLVPPTDTVRAAAMLTEAIGQAETSVPGVHGAFVITGDRPAIERDDASPLLAALRRSVREVTGQEAVVGCFPGYTDTAVIAGTLHGHSCMSYGPGSLELAHKPDEWVPVRDILRCEAVFCRLTEL